MTSQLALLVRQLTISQRIGVGFGALATAFVLVAFVLWAGRTEMQPAFSRLTAEEAAAITDALRGAKVPFEVADAGATILVAAPKVADARIAAAAAGATTSGPPGFELFDEQGFGASEFDQTVAYQRAIEGKLARTIGAMDGVAGATVSVVQARQGLFAEQDRPASASVNIRMRAGAPPDPAMVRGIVSTVAGSVAGLTAENVTVVDATGRVLAGASGTDETGDAAAARAAVERSLAGKVQGLVDQALGPGHASVAVSAELDMDRVEQERTTVVPIDTDNWTPASVQRTGEWYTGSGPAGAGGLAGAGSNIPGLPTYPGMLPGAPAPSGDPAASPAPSAEATPPTGGYARQQETVNYANSQTIEKIVRAGGAVKRLSVAVLVDESAMRGLPSETLTRTIQAAIGADAQRGDVVSVSTVAFAGRPAEPEGGFGSDIGQTVGTVVGALVGILVALVLTVLVWRNLRALHDRAEEAELLALARPKELAASYGPDGTPAIAELGDGAAPEAASGRIQQQLRAVAQERPEELAGLVSGWMRQEARQ